MALGMLLPTHAPRVSPLSGGRAGSGRGPASLYQLVPLLPGTPGGWRSSDGSFLLFSLLPLKKRKRKWDLRSPRTKALCLRGIALAPSSVRHALLGILLSVGGWMPGMGDPSLTHPLPWQRGEQCTLLALPGAGEGDSPAGSGHRNAAGAREELRDEHRRSRSGR